MAGFAKLSSQQANSGFPIQQSGSCHEGFAVALLYQR
jgi:hypothetical protein